MMMKRFIANFKECQKAQAQLRRDYWDDGELALWITSIVFYPLWLLLSVGFAAYYTFKP